MLRNAEPCVNIVPLNYVESDRSGKSRIVDQNAPSCALQYTAVAELLQTIGTNEIDIVKFDIEGAEKQVFADEPKWLQQIRYVTVETDDRWVPECLDSGRDRDS